MTCGTYGTKPKHQYLYSMHRYATRFGFEFTPVPLVMSKVLGASDSSQLHQNRYFKERESSLPDMADMAFPLNELTIAEHMQKTGYHTMLVGKWHLGHSPGHRPVQRGFDDMLGFNLGKLRNFQRCKYVNKIGLCACNLIRSLTIHATLTSRRSRAQT